MNEQLQAMFKAESERIVDYFNGRTTSLIEGGTAPDDATMILSRAVFDLGIYFSALAMGVSQGEATKVVGGVRGFFLLLMGVDNSEETNHPE